MCPEKMLRMIRRLEQERDIKSNRHHSFWLTAFTLLEVLTVLDYGFNRQLHIYMHVLQIYPKYSIKAKMSLFHTNV